MAQLGDPIPDLVIKNENGDNFDLKSLVGRKTILYFYPKDSSPGCTNQAVAFEYEREHLEEHGYQIVGVSVDSPDSHEKFKQTYLLNFTLLSDSERELCEHMNVWVTKRMYGKSYMGVQRSTFVYDEQGTLIKIYPKVKPADHARELLDDIAKGRLPG